MCATTEKQEAADKKKYYCSENPRMCVLNNNIIRVLFSCYAVRSPGYVYVLFCSVLFSAVCLFARLDFSLLKLPF